MKEHLSCKRPLLLISILLLSQTLQLANASSQPVHSHPEAAILQDPVHTAYNYSPETGVVQLTPPAKSISFYVEYLNRLGNLGAALGNTHIATRGLQDDLVILDFGYMMSVIQGGVRIYGVKLVPDPAGIFTSLTAVITSTVAFASGYHAVAYAQEPGSHVRLVVSVNSHAVGDISFWQGHGAAWANTINTIKSQIGNITTQVDVVAGGDFETGPGWGKPYEVHQWLNKYIEYSDCIPGEDNSVDGCFYNFGNLTIPIYGTECADSVNDDWNACDVWYISWGALKNGRRFARPLPEIYHSIDSLYPYGTDAKAWKDLSIFSHEQKVADPMFFAGSLTQRGTCNDSCTEGNNYSWEGFHLLSSALASHPTSRMGMRWSTDMSWQP
jgi:hypothetical protein